VSNIISTPVLVSLISDPKTNRVYPKLITWNGRDYSVLKVGLHHTFREGRVLYHVFSVATSTLFITASKNADISFSSENVMKLLLNSETLHWKLEEVWDGF
jgi:hypothetical protein